MRGVLPASEVVGHDAAGAALDSGVEVDLQQGGGEWLTPGVYAELQRHLRACQASPVIARCDLSGRPLPGSHHELTRQISADLLAGIEHAGRLGATYLCVTLLRAGDRQARAGAVGYADALNAIYASLCATHGAAEAAGLTVAIMAARHRFLLSPAECRDLIDEVNAPNVGMAVEVTDVSAVGDVADWIQTLRQRLTLIRFGRPTEPIGQRTLKALEQISFDGPIIFERADDLMRWLPAPRPPASGHGHEPAPSARSRERGAFMPTDDLVTIATLTNPHEAEMMRLRLTGEGIFCFLDGIAQGAAVGLLSIKVMVRPADAERARTLIEPQNA